MIDMLQSFWPWVAWPVMAFMLHHIIFYRYKPAVQAYIKVHGLQKFRKAYGSTERVEILSLIQKLFYASTILAITFTL